MRRFASNILEETDPEDIEVLYELIDRMVDAEETHRLVTKCKMEGQRGINLQLTAVNSSSDVSEGDPSDLPVDAINAIDDTIEDLKSIKSAIRDVLLKKCMVDPKRKNDVFTVYDNVLKFLRIRDVLTTNYDNVIETYCEGSGITLTNGFQPSFHGDRRKWAGNPGKAESGALRLVKMHGSITWQKDGDDVLELGRPGARGEERDVMIYPEKRPKRYGKSIFPDLKRTFREVLADTDLLVVVGYSFRDEEINHMIKRRLDAGSQQKSMILLYLDPEHMLGMSNLMGRRASPRAVRTSRCKLQVYSTRSMPHMYAHDLEFGPATSNVVQDAVNDLYKY